jgi:5'-deoxynucleotidase YfbR-like HD superfamily hydrolase
MLFGDLTRLRSVIRYSSIFVYHKESVAEHTFFTALYALLICMDYNNRHSVDKAIPIDEVLQKAIFHDIEECKTGDILRPFKHATPELKHMIHNIASKELVRTIAELHLDNSVIEKISHFWENSKLERSGMVVALADYLSVLMFMIREAKSRNPEIIAHVPTMNDYFKTFLSKDYDFLRTYIDQAEILANQFTRLCHQEALYGK